MSNPDQSTDAPGAQTDPKHRWAMSHVPSHMRLWIVASLGLTADLWSKAWAFKTLSFESTQTLIDGLCGLQLSLNPGALFGLGHGYAPIFVGASVLALLFVVYLFANSTANRWSMHIALGLVLAGALGNLYDRTMHEGYVVEVAGGGGGRVIGTLVNKTDTTVTLGQYPDGADPSVWRIEPGSEPGPQPVVRDFIKIEAKIGKYSLWPWIFNIADALLVVGVAMLLINFWFDHRHHEASHRDAADSGEAQAEA